MKCKNSKNLIMKYMDKTLTIEEAEKLNCHISDCEICKSDFLAYDFILDELDNEASILYELPSDFDAAVMEEIYKLDLKHSLLDKDVLENILSVFWGGCSVLFGLGVILYIYRDFVLKQILANQNISEYVKSFIPSHDIFSEYFDAVSSYISYLFINIGNLISASRYIFLAICFVLVIIQIVLHNKSKNKVES